MIFVTILAVCALFSCLPVHAKNACQDGWVPFNGKCFYISTQRANWHASVTNCYEKGSRLASVKSRDELNFLTSYAEIRKAGIWLDGNDLNNEGKWIWSFNNEPIKLTYWHPNEPNGKGRENCLMIHKFSGKWKWNDESCKTPLFFACQKKMQASSEKQCLSTKDLLDELIRCKKRCK